jgi:hypothetical protein
MHFQSPPSQDLSGKNVFTSALAKLLATTAKLWLLAAQPQTSAKAKRHANGQNGKNAPIGHTQRLLSSNANKSFMGTTS